MRLVVRVPLEPHTTFTREACAGMVGGHVTDPATGKVGTVVHAHDSGGALELTIDADDDSAVAAATRGGGAF